MLSADLKKIYLIHGTWAQGSEWTDPENNRSKISSSLREKAKESGQKVEIEKYEWSGKNSSAERNAAAFLLAQKITSDLSDKNTKVILIGHSHGGNVAISSLEYLSAEMINSVEIVTMATPFFKRDRIFTLQKIRKSTPELIQRNFSLFLAVPAITFLTYLVFTIFSLGIYDISLHVALLGWVISSSIMVKISELVEASILNHLKKSKKKDYINRSRILVTSYSVDEAMIGLQLITLPMLFIQAVAYFCAMLLILILRKIMQFDITLVFGWCIMAILVWLSLAYSMAEAINFGLDININIDSFDFLSMEDGWVIYTFFMLAIIFIYGGITMYLLIITFLISGFLRAIVFSIAGASDLSSMKIGFIDTIFESITVSPIPSGSHKNFILNSNRLFNHSLIYISKDSIDKITEFVFPNKNK